MWSHRSPYKDQRDNKKANQGKELCDLLAVFENDLFIFQEKTCGWPPRGDLTLRWSRWHRRAIEDAAGQLSGAERWLRDFPDRIFADAACTIRLPVEFPPSTEQRVHRLIVASGAANACRQHFGGGSGALMLDTHPMAKGSLFTVGSAGPSVDLVHVLDEATFELVIGELDTIPEFRDYLLAKERLVEEGKHFAAPGEEDLLAFYLQNEDPKRPNQHGFGDTDGFDVIYFPEGEWETFGRSLHKKARDEANRYSRDWDRLIERFAKHSIEGTQYYSTHGNPLITEQTLRLMSAEPRTMRRALVEDVYKNLSSMGGRPYRVWGSISPAGFRTCYTFLALSQNAADDYAEYRRRRLRLLEICTAIMRLEYPHAGAYVGIAMTPWENGETSEAVLLLADEAWTPELQEEARKFQRELGLLNELKHVRLRESEYPRPTLPPGTPGG